MSLWGISHLIHQIGEVAEWFKAAVLKTAEVKASVGSNPTLSVAPCEQNASVAQLDRAGFL